jgi:hypothetical protein
MPNLRARLLKAGIVQAFQVSLPSASIDCKLSKPEHTNSMNTLFQFRLNGLIITHLKVRPVVTFGTTDKWELVACHEMLGDFAIDDNELVDSALTPFILEVRDAMVPPIERRFLPNKGWRQVTTRQCLALLESSGVIDAQ